MNRDNHGYRISPSLKFTITDTHLIEEGSHGVRHWRQAWPLQQLSPEFEYQTARPHGTTERLIGGLAILAVAVAVYFSEVNAKVPLLAPLLLIAGVIIAGRGFKSYRIDTWTTIRRWDGNSATYFSHRDCNAGERKAFEEALAEAVRDARRARGADE